MTVTQKIQKNKIQISVNVIWNMDLSVSLCSLVFNRCTYHCPALWILCTLYPLQQTNICHISILLNPQLKFPFERLHCITVKQFLLENKTNGSTADSYKVNGSNTSLLPEPACSKFQFYGLWRNMNIPTMLINQ